MHPPLLKGVDQVLLVEVDILLVILQIFLDGAEELEVLLVAPRVAEGEPVILDRCFELKAERHLDLVILFSSPLYKGEFEILASGLTQTKLSGVRCHGLSSAVRKTGLMPSLQILC